MLKGSVLCVECGLECGAALRCCQHWHRLFAILFDNLYNRCRCRIELLSRQVIVLFQASNTEKGVQHLMNLHNGWQELVDYYNQYAYFPIEKMERIDGLLASPDESGSFIRQ